MLREEDMEKTPKPMFSDHTKCYVWRSKCGTASNYICGGERNKATGELVEKCVHCRFFFPVPKIKDVTSIERTDKT